MIPQWLLSNDPEFFTHDNKVYAYYLRHLYEYVEFPEVLIDIVETAMLRDKHAFAALNTMHDSREDMIEQYIRCVLGNFDADSDIVVSNMTVNPEYVECDKRGQCPHEGKLCKSLKIGLYVITHQEIRVMKLISQGMLDKEIADALKISINTVNNHCANIREKTGLRSKVEIARWVTQKNL